GSSLIGQQFTSDRYFHGRPSSTLNASTGKPQPYSADHSAGSNYAPSNQALIDRAQKEVDSLRQQNPGSAGQQCPVARVTSNCRGLEPDISEASALFQVDRVAQARSLDPAKVRQLVEDHLQGRVLWIFGESYVNVLDVNMALDKGQAG